MVRGSVAVGALVLGACVPAALVAGGGEPDATTSDAATDGGDGGAPCQLPTDCPVGQACDPMTDTCSPSCNSQTPCNGGCCGGGLCQAGDASSYCGNLGSACSTCAGPTPTCSAGACIATCSLDAGCEAGECCIGGSCMPGSSDTACGLSGPCADCTKTSSVDGGGHRCINGHCGCMAAADCPQYEACAADGQCQSSCLTDAATGCNGGCCDPTSHKCTSGGLHADCGNSGGYCFMCPTGTACLNSGYGCWNNSTCGCYGADQDAADQRCNRDCHTSGLHCNAVHGGICVQ